MLDQIKLFFEKHIALSHSKTTQEKLQIACAALLIEMMQIDDKIREEEQKTVANKLQELFSISPEQITSLMELALTEKESSPDYFQFTHLINKEFSEEQKISLIEALWRVAYADNNLDLYEEYMVRKIADLLYVPHTDFIMLKDRVKTEIMGE